MTNVGSGSVGRLVQLWPKNEKDAWPWGNDWLTTHTKLAKDGTQLEVMSEWLRGKDRMFQVSWFDSTHGYCSVPVLAHWCSPSGTLVAKSHKPLATHEDVVYNYEWKITTNPKPKIPDCTCTNIMAGCTCGHMAANMKAQGKVKNTTTGLWEDA